MGLFRILLFLPILFRLSSQQTEVWNDHALRPEEHYVCPEWKEQCLFWYACSNNMGGPWNNAYADWVDWEYADAQVLDVTMFAEGHVYNATQPGFNDTQYATFQYSLNGIPQGSPITSTIGVFHSQCDDNHFCTVYQNVTTSGAGAFKRGEKNYMTVNVLEGVLCIAYLHLVVHNLVPAPTPPPTPQPEQFKCNSCSLIGHWTFDSESDCPYPQNDLNIEVLSFTDQQLDGYVARVNNVVAKDSYVSHASRSLSGYIEPEFRCARSSALYQYYGKCEGRFSLEYDVFPEELMESHIFPISPVTWNISFSHDCSRLRIEFSDGSGGLCLKNSKWKNAKKDVCSACPEGMESIFSNEAIRCCETGDRGKWSEFETMRAANLSSVAYSNPDDRVLELTNLGYSLEDILYVDDPHVGVVVDPCLDALVVFLRGTVKWSLDPLVDAMFTGIPFIHKDVYAHKGFYLRANRVANTVRKVFNKWDKIVKKFSRVVVSGHSLGAGAGYLVYELLRNSDKQRNYHGYGFAQPMATIFDPHSRLRRPSWRSYIFENDIVAHINVETLNYGLCDCSNSLGDLTQVWKKLSRSYLVTLCAEHVSRVLRTPYGSIMRANNPAGPFFLDNLPFSEDWMGDENMLNDHSMSNYLHVLNPNYLVPPQTPISENDFEVCPIELLYETSVCQNTPTLQCAFSRVLRSLFFWNRPKASLLRSRQTDDLFRGTLLDPFVFCVSGTNDKGVWLTIATVVEIETEILDFSSLDLLGFEPVAISSDTATSLVVALDNQGLLLSWHGDDLSTPPFYTIELLPTLKSSFFIADLDILTDCNGRLQMVIADSQNDWVYHYQWEDTDPESSDPMILGGFSLSKPKALAIIIDKLSPFSVGALFDDGSTVARMKVDDDGNVETLWSLTPNLTCCGSDLGYGNGVIFVQYPQALIVVDAISGEILNQSQSEAHKSIAISQLSSYYAALSSSDLTNNDLVYSPYLNSIAPMNCTFPKISSGDGWLKGAEWYYWFAGAGLIVFVIFLSCCCLCGKRQSYKTIA